jgi:hypothetical protein
MIMIDAQSARLLACKELECSAMKLMEDRGASAPLGIVSGVYEQLL